MRSRPVGLWCWMLVALVACADALDWREMRPPGLQVSVSMPCKPTRLTRKVRLAEQALDMTMLACSAQSWTFAISAVELSDPAKVGPALTALQGAAVANIQGQVLTNAPAEVPGMTPHPAARRLSIAGRLSDGKPVREQVMLFSRGLRVYQATVVGGEGDGAVAATFLDSLRAWP